MPRASPRKKSTVDYTETNDTDMKPATKGLAGKVVAKAKHAASAAAPKRKADPEPPAAQAPTAAKKRKTKAKDEGSAPAAERTAVSSLKKPMYIGAHISAAGGMCRGSLPCPRGFANEICRCSERHHQCDPHRRQLVRPLYEVPAQMG